MAMERQLRNCRLRQRLQANIALDTYTRTAYCEQKLGINNQFSQINENGRKLGLASYKKKQKKNGDPDAQAVKQNDGSKKTGRSLKERDWQGKDHTHE